MDFGTLLQTAKENEYGGKKEVKYYSTKFAPPKKEEKKARNLSANIQKFLARKEAEEKKKVQASNRKRDELLALRSKDRKATRRVNVMLKRTKSANQSVIEDAVDRDNTAVTLAGPSQPDEDDYGYVSQEAAAYYNKMMEKYNKMPDDPKFPTTKKKASNNLSSTKDRVKAALEREKEEAMLPHRRKRKHKEEGDSQANEHQNNDSDDQDRMEQPPAKMKPKANAPPPLNFSELLKLAAQKQHEPIVIEVKPKEDEGPLLTKKQKREIEKERVRRETKLQTGKMPPPSKPIAPTTEGKVSRPSLPQQNDDRVKRGPINQPPKPSEHRSNDKMAKANIPNYPPSGNSLSKTKNPLAPSQKLKSRDNPVSSKIPNGDSNMPRPRNGDSSSFKTPKPPPRPEASSNSNRPDPSRRKPFTDVPRKNQDFNSMPSNRKSDPPRSMEKKSLPPKSIPGSSAVQSSCKPISNKSITNADSQRRDLKLNGSPKPLEKSKQLATSSGVRGEKLSSTTNMQPKRFPPSDLKPKQFPPQDLKPKQFPPSDLRPKQFPPNDLKPKQFPPRDLKPKQFPPPDVRRREFPPKDVKRKPQIGNKRRILDDDEYDSEMDDFIDDGPEEEEDYSKYIKDIFGYDKNKYRVGDEDDIDNMESTFAQQMREDVRSTKLGIMEDLEDIKREKEEKRRKAIMKKRKL